MSTSQNISNFVMKKISILKILTRSKKIKLVKNDRKIISEYLNTCLNIHFSELKNIKSLKILKSLLN